MKKRMLAALLCLLLMLTACGREQAPAVTHAPEAQETLTPQTTVPETTVPETTEAPDTQPAAQGIRPEFKQAMDDYEAFFTEYCEFMKKYQESDDTVALLSDYMDFMERYTEAMEALDTLEESDMSPEELDYYLEVMERINNMLLDCL